MNRRTFIQMTAGAAVVSASEPLARARPRQSGPVGANDRVRFAIIGAGNRGNQVLNSFELAKSPTALVAAAEVFKERLDATVQQRTTAGNKVDAYEDYRRVLDRKDIDVVLIAAPDHWHPKMTIDACAAGKDVYMEKPACNEATLEEAVLAIQAARKHNRVVQVGTQQRSWPHFAEAKALLPELGGVTHVILQFGGGGSPVTEPVIPAPAGLNWEGFQGPAPRKPYKNGRHRGWRYYLDYGGGLMTDWGVHLMDTALWFMDAQLEAPMVTTGVGQYVNVENPDRERPHNAFTGSWQYRKFVMTFSNAVIGNPEFGFNGTVFIGPRGSMVVNRSGYMLRPPALGPGGRGRGAGLAAAGAAAPGQRGAVAPARPTQPATPPRPPLEAKIVRAGDEMETVHTSTTLHVNNFLECVKSRQKPVSDVEIGFYATLPCVLSLRAMREGSAFTWDKTKMSAKAL
jgi:predicted dehydrogenase